MAAPLVVSLPPDLILWDGCTIRVAAISPTTGNIVAGVNVSNVALEVELVSNVSGDVGDLLSSGTFTAYDPVLLRTLAGLG